MQHSLNLLPGVGPARRKILNESGIYSLEDLVEYYPRGWQDRTQICKISELQEGDTASVVGVLEKVHLISGRKMRLSMVLQDDEGNALQMAFFHQIKALQHRFAVGHRVCVVGKVGWFNGPQMVHPEITRLGDNEEFQGGIVPVYSISEKMKKGRVDQRFLQRIIEASFKFSTLKLKDEWPKSLRQELGFVGRMENARRLHQPQNMEDVQKGFRQLKLREILPVSLRMARRREQMKRRGRAHAGGRALAEKLKAQFPFTLTHGQEVSLERIISGMEADRQHQSLLQGDVGSGKTAVAAIACAAALGAGVQAAIMAPTEILAKQHYDEFFPLFAELGFDVVFLSGSTPTKARREILDNLRLPKPLLAVGTHALFSKDVQFDQLGFVVIDEQHRFGVGQRKTLLEKGEDPDLLAMSATPIPRSLVMTLYGDLEPIVMKEKPAGRKPVQTRLVPDQRQKDLIGYIQKEVDRGNRAYWVVPRVEDDEASELQSVENRRDLLQSYLQGINVGSVHGKMPEDEKLNAIQRFKKGDDPVLVSTTVIEVGVNVPEAGIIVIEGADRFGLAQLHQLRGRVGRGGQEGWCFLIGGQGEAAQRLQDFSGTENGFDIAELDLKLRGSGNLEGLKQSGMSSFRFFDFVRDRELIQAASELSHQKIIQWDSLNSEEKDLFVEWSQADQVEVGGIN